MRMEKIKSGVALGGALRHNTREVMPKNADPALSDGNYCPFSTEESLKRFKGILPEKVRKNAVVAIETVITASPEWFEKATSAERKEFFGQSEDWVRKFFGNENVLNVAIHRDEKTPHMHVIAMPIVDGKLNAKALIGGTKYRMRDLQDDFYASLSKKLGLDRGISKEETGSKHRKPRDLLAVVEEKNRALDEREGVINRREQVFQEVMGFNPEQVRLMAKELDEWHKRTPTEFRKVAEMLEKNGVKDIVELDRKLKARAKGRSK